LLLSSRLSDKLKYFANQPPTNPPTLFARYNYNDQIKEDKMGGTCSMNGKEEKCISILVGKLEGKRLL
jgi:hypothetical protein